MSEYVDIQIKSLSLYCFRNYLEKRIVELFFSKQDLMITPNYIVDPEDTDCMPFTRYLLKTTVEKARERLDSLGYGINNLEKIFNSNIYEAVDYSAFLSHLRVEYSEQELKAHERIDKNVTFKKWSNSMRKIIEYELEYGNISRYREENSLKLSTECDKVIYYDLIDCDSESFYALNPEIINEAYIFRLILENCNDEDEIILDFSNIDNWADDCIPKALETIGNVERVIVLVEGTSDKDILEFALSKLYPHVADLFYFMDFADNNGRSRAGGVSEIRKHMETFYYSKLPARFIAVFDNDAVGYHNMYLLSNEIKDWPNNFSIMCYPELPEFKNYPTLASNGSIISDDINKKACSIELYLPNSIIMNGESYYPIEWENREKIKKKDGSIECLYQGVISEKNEIKTKFHELRKEIEKKEGLFHEEEWTKMKKLLEKIIFAFR